MLRLKEARNSKGFTQENVAKYLGVSRPAYTRYEKGTRECSFDTLSKLANYFGVTTDYLLGEGKELESPLEKPLKKPKDLMKLLEQEQSLTMNGEVLGEEDMEIIKSAIEQGYFLAKKLNKRKKDV